MAPGHEENIAKAGDVAALLIERDPSVTLVDIDRLGALLYLVQGALLNLWAKPAFGEAIEAGASGPVVRLAEGGDPRAVPPETAAVVDLVLSYYGRWSTESLLAFVTSPATPWADARLGLQVDAATVPVIDEAQIVRWFGRRGVGPDEPSCSEEDRALFERVIDGDEEALAALMR